MKQEICQREGSVFSWDKGVLTQAGAKTVATVRAEVWEKKALL